MHQVFMMGFLPTLWAPRQVATIHRLPRSGQETSSRPKRNLFRPRNIGQSKELRAIKTSALFICALGIALTSSTSPTVGAEPVRPGLQHCFAGVRPDQRQQCDQEASEQIKARSQSTPLDQGWRLVRTREPATGVLAVSVMHVADTAKSDIGLAGLSLRCSQSGIEVVLVLLTPLPRSSRPVVSLQSGSRKTDFEATVTQGGEALLLPQSAASLAAGEWQNAGELAIEIGTTPDPIRGTVPIRGLSGALRELTSGCMAK